MSAENTSSQLRVVDGRECGSCVACCQILDVDVPELKKPANVLCPNCTGSGCGIYPNRPNICRTWFCLWRWLPDMADHLRPDKTGVIFSFDQNFPPKSPFEKHCLIAWAIDDEAAFSRPDVKAAIEMLISKAAFPLWLSFGGLKWLIYPAADLADAIENPSTTAHRHLLPQAMEWRRKLELE
jgi:hypothetical protein